MGPVLFMAPELLQTCLLVAGVYFSQVYYHARYGPQVLPQLLVILDRRINDCAPDIFKIKFHFLQHHAFSVMSCVGIGPNDIVCDNGSRFHCEEALLIVLFRIGL